MKALVFEVFNYSDPEIQNRAEPDFKTNQNKLSCQLRF